MEFSNLTFTAFTLLFFAIHTKTIQGYIKCYSCDYQYSNETSDDSCITNPTIAVDCGHNMCTVSRTWNIEAGRIESFNRACVDPALDPTDKCQKTSTYEWCNTYCETSYCNNGTGILDYDIQCYSCSYDKGDNENANCVSNPGGVADPVTNCSSPAQCYTSKHIHTVTGELEHVSRGCADTFDACSKDGMVENCTSVCRDKDFCNEENVQVTTPANGFQCYLCNCAGEDCSTHDCFTKPGQQPTVFCAEGKYCYVMRIDILETGDIWNFGRGCEVYTDPVDKCTPEAARETCYTYCQNDRCNDGDAIPDDPPITAANTLVIGMTSFLIPFVCALCWH